MLLLAVAMPCCFCCCLRFIHHVCKCLGIHRTAGEHTLMLLLALAMPESSTLRSPSASLPCCCAFRSFSSARLSSCCSFEYVSCSSHVASAPADFRLRASTHCRSGHQHRLSSAKLSSCCSRMQTALHFTGHSSVCHPETKVQISCGIRQHEPLQPD